MLIILIYLNIIKYSTHKLTDNFAHKYIYTIKNILFKLYIVLFDVFFTH